MSMQIDFAFLRFLRRDPSHMIGPNPLSLVGFLSATCLARGKHVIHKCEGIKGICLLFSPSKCI